MRNLKLTLSYDGSGYFGWQECSEGPTIEGSLKAAAQKMLGHGVVLQAASRTDRGVHAREQVVNFFTPSCLPLENIKRGLNALLPPTIRILSMEEKPEAFHPTLDVKGKEYLYTLCNGKVQLPHHRLYSWHIYHPLDLFMMKQKALASIGEHDFSPYMNRSALPCYSDTIRTIHSIDIAPFEENRIKIFIRGDNFLYKMVRNLVGAFVYAGRGREGGVCAPAHGLTLNRLFY